MVAAADHLSLFAFAAGAQAEVMTGPERKGARAAAMRWASHSPMRRVADDACYTLAKSPRAFRPRIGLNHAVVRTNRDVVNFRFVDQNSSGTVEAEVPPNGLGQDMQKLLQGTYTAYGEIDFNKP